MDRPNILLIMTDEQRADGVGYCNPQLHTPALDALAADSIVFQNAYTTNPSCVPARAAIFTGRYPSQCGAPTFITYLPETETTFMSLLRAGGYYTAVTGKQHFGNTRIERGYDEENIVDEHGPALREGGPSSSYDRFLRENGFTRKEQLSCRDGRYAWRWLAGRRFHVDEFIGDKANRWLSQTAPTLGKPWFLTVSFPGPHQPFDGIGLPEEQLYREDQIDLPHTGEADLAGKPSYYMDQLETGHGNPGVMPVKGMTPEQARHVRKAYYAKISLIDRKIGELIATLKRYNLYDNTMILFFSDHGDFMGEFGMLGKGQYLSEALMRIPFLIKPPAAGFKGYTEQSYVSSVEVAATCLTAAGVPLPENIAGRSLTRFWTEQTPEREDSVYMEAGNIRALICKQWKLIYYANRTYGELYDLRDDPYEKRNLWAEPQYERKKNELVFMLCDRMIHLGARSYVPWNKNAPAF